MFSTIAQTDLVIYIITGLMGLVTCFFGYRLFRIWLAFAGLQTGFYFGLWFGDAIFKSGFLVLVLAILGAALMATLYAVLIRVGAFLSGAGVLVLLAVLTLQGLPFGTNPYVLMAAFFMGGILGVVMLRPFLILATAVNGAFLIVDSLANLLAGAPISQYVPLHRQLGGGNLILQLIGLVVLVILGALVQFRMARAKTERGKSAVIAEASSQQDSKPVNSNNQTI